MKPSFLLLAIAQVAASVTTACNANNCARAVTGTRLPQDYTSHKNDCSSFMRITVTPATSTSTVFTTGTITQRRTTTTQTQVVSTTLTLANANKRNVEMRGNLNDILPRQVTISPSKIPTYASACASAAAYSSACSCFGITPITITLSSPVTTITITNTATRTTFGTGSTTTTTTVTACSPSATMCSSGTCVNLQTDSNNCGVCGKACGSGFSCIGGTCTSNIQASSCPQGSDCNSIGCPGTGACLCLTTDLGFLCADIGNENCGSPRCTTSAECGAGNVCDISNCCGYGICTAINSCGNPSSPSRLFRVKSKKSVNGSEGQPAHI